MYNSLRRRTRLLGFTYMTTFGSRLARLLAPVSFFFASFSLALAQSTSGGAANQTTGAGSLDQLGRYLNQFIVFFDRYLVPLIFAIAFIVFLWGVYTYFILGGANEEKRQEGQKFVMYAIIGFALMISVWGIVNLLNNSFGFAGQNKPALPTFGGSATTQTTGGSGLPASGSASGGGNATVPSCITSGCANASYICNRTTGLCESAGNLPY